MVLSSLPRFPTLLRRQEHCIARRRRMSCHRRLSWLPGDCECAWSLRWISQEDWQKSLLCWLRFWSSGVGWWRSSGAVWIYHLAWALGLELNLCNRVGIALVVVVFVSVSSGWRRTALAREPNPVRPKECGLVCVIEDKDSSCRKVGWMRLVRGVLVRQTSVLYCDKYWKFLAPTGWVLMRVWMMCAFWFRSLLSLCWRRYCFHVLGITVMVGVLVN